MKLVDYSLQTQMEYLSSQKPKEYFKDFLKSVLQDENKPYYKKADYVGLSLGELKNKIDVLSSDIKELQALKKRLSSALDIAKEVTAEVLIENGVDRIDGTIISSITISKETSKEEKSIKILDENRVMGLGYVKFEPDLEAIKNSLDDKELEPYIEVSSNIKTTPARVKVNTKRSPINTQADELVKLADVA